MENLQNIVEDKRFSNFIIGVILVNAIVLGLMTLDFSPGVMSLLGVIDTICLVIFCAEILMKLVVMRTRFFRDGWNIFDFVVVGIALLPATGPLSVLRTLRVLRLLRLVTAVPSMKRVVNGMFVALPGGASVAAVLLVLYYVAAIIADSLYSEGMPRYFGDMGTTFFTLFQLMTIEGWNGIADEVMEVYPHSWIFFVTFIIFTAFTTLNLLFGIIVDAMESAKEEEVREEMAEQGIAVDDISTDMRVAIIEEDVKHIRALLERAEAQAAAARAGTPVP